MADHELIRGVFNVSPTPFSPDGALDEPSINKLTNLLIDQGVHGITILGVMGEAAKVSEAEREKIVSSFLEAANGRVPICVGTSHAATRQCIQFSRQAQELGAAAVMVAPPALARSNDAALKKHYLAVAEAVQIPVVVQDYPGTTGILMSAKFLAELAEESPQCRFIKMEDEPTAPKVARVLANNPQAVLLGGSGGIAFLEELRNGAAGIMTGFGFSEVLVEIYEKYSAGDIDGATEVFYRYSPLIRFENQPRIGMPLRKYVYFLRGAIDSPYAREPSSPLEDSTINDLKDILSRLELLG